MTDSPNARTADGGWRTPQKTARELRDALAALGIPRTELESVGARRDLADGDYVHIGALSIASAKLLLGALGQAATAGTPR